MTAQNRQASYQKTWTLWNMFKYSEEGKTLFGNRNYQTQPIEDDSQN